MGKGFPSWEFEWDIFGKNVIGVDEVGRGALAGPLFVCAVKFIDYPEVQWMDSKLMSSKQRERAFELLTGHVQYGLGAASVSEIDRLGIRKALELASERALAFLDLTGQIVVFDGPVPLTSVPKEYSCMVRADSKLPSVAAASVIAKVSRDRLMSRLSDVFPAYGFANNKGYASPDHISAIRTYGLTPLHRRSFIGSILEQTLF
ncbi:ribonuclease HII [Coprothermobacteraceae bacterium]|nr:ribonuclease HII [Coprothermobacteraceae bacterium]